MHFFSPNLIQVIDQWEDLIPNPPYKSKATFLLYRFATALIKDASIYPRRFSHPFGVNYLSQRSNRSNLGKCQGDRWKRLGRRPPLTRHWRNHNDNDHDHKHTHNDHNHHNDHNDKQKNKTITINDLTRAVKTVKEAIEASGLSPGEISGIVISLLTFLVTCVLGCLKLMAHLRAGGTVQEFLAGVLETALIRLRRRQRLGQQAVQEAASSSASNPDRMVGRETEVWKCFQPQTP